MRAELRLYQIPAEIERIDELMSELFLASQPLELDPSSEGDLKKLKAMAASRGYSVDQMLSEARQAQHDLQLAVDGSLADLEPRLRELGSSYHGWLRRLREEAEAARAEEDRVEALRKIREAKLDRIKTYVRDTLIAARLTKLEGPSWRLRTQRNGGKPPVRWVSGEPVPVIFAAKVSLSPAELVARVKHLAVSSDVDELTDDQVASALIESPLTFSAEHANAFIDRYGEIPEGVVVLEPGHHLRIE